jgi:hypothetical protein
VEGLGDLLLETTSLSPKVRSPYPAAKTRTARAGCVTIDPTRLPKLVSRLLDAAREEESLVDELCGAVLRTDWNAASNAAAALMRHRGGAAAKAAAGVDTAGG